MESIKKIYKIGYGPSSSHTMGPRKAAIKFLEEQKGAASFRITLYGSLAATGKGHLTDLVINEIFKDKQMELVWKPEIFPKRHSNGLKFEAFDSSNQLIKEWNAYSIGGGDIIDTDEDVVQDEIYPQSNMEEVLKWCYDNGQHLWELVEHFEGKEIWEYLAQVWEVMSKAVERGLDTEGALPGVLKLPRKAASYYSKAQNLKGTSKQHALVYAYALAVSEENAGGGEIVTSPTCGACGVLPAVLYYQKKFYKASDNKILRALATAGLIGTLVKKNASISGAEVGCQGEVGTACAMASGAITQLNGGTIFQVEYAAEMGLEHHLGLTCDPVAGLVQIPCIERNAFAAARSLNHKDYALLSDGRHYVSFDQVVQTMKQTGKDLPNLYKETSEGGLAIFHGIKK